MKTRVSATAGEEETCPPVTSLHTKVPVIKLIAYKCGSLEPKNKDPGTVKANVDIAVRCSGRRGYRSRDRCIVIPDCLPSRLIQGDNDGVADSAYPKEYESIAYGGRTLDVVGNSRSPEDCSILGI